MLCLRLLESYRVRTTRPLSVWNVVFLYKMGVESCVRLCSGWFGDLLLDVRIVQVVICHLRVASFVAYLPFECELLVCPTLFVICPSPLCGPAAS